MVNEEVTMTMSVLPGAMTGISTLMAGMVSINNIFMDVTRQIDSTFGLVDSSIITTGTVIAQFGLQAADAFGKFEQGMKIAQMVSGATKQEMAELSQVANQFSVQYRVDIDQITEGLQTLGRAGLNSTSEQAEVLKNGLNTAKLEGRDLNGVLEELIQNTALLGGNLKSSDFGEDSQYVNDLLVSTSMTAPITTHDVSETLKYSGGIAAAAGAHIRDEKGNVDEKGKEILEDYMGAIAAFAQKGVTGSIAGTALRAFFNKPATQDSSVTEALASIHLKPEYLWEEDEETMKPVSEQIEIIQKQMDKLDVSTMDRLQIWSKIVGGKMGQQMMKLESEDIKELTKDIRKADDAGSLAANSMKTYQANMKQMAEQGQVAFREFGGNVAQVLNPVLQVITQILGLLSNPVVSKGLFAGFIVAMVKVYSTIKKVLSNLKTEFTQFMSYFKSGETLMAVRPSVIRGIERKNGKNDYSKSSAKSDEIKSVKDLTDAYKAEAQSDRLAQLRARYSDSQIAAMEITSKWDKKFIDSDVHDSELMKELIKSKALPKEAFNDIFTLPVDEWRDKWAEVIRDTAQLDNAIKKVTRKTETVDNLEEMFPIDTYLDEKPGNVDSEKKVFDPFNRRKIGDNWKIKNSLDNVVDDENKFDPLNRRKIGDNWRTNITAIPKEAESVVDTAVKAVEETSDTMTKFNRKVLDFFIKDAGGDKFNKNGYGVSVVDEYGLTHGETAGRVPPIVREILANPMQDVDLDKFYSYDFQKDVDSYLKNHDMNEKGTEILKQSLGNEHLFGNSQAFFDKKMQELREYFAPTYFDSVDELSKKKTELTGKSKDKFMSMPEIRDYIDKTYGIQVSGKNRMDLAKNAFPYLSDWSLDGRHKDGMTNKEFQDFAKSLGASVSGKRSEMIDQLNAHLKYNQYESPLNQPVYRYVSQPTGEISGQAELNELAQDAEKFREAAKLQVEAAQMQLRIAEERAGVGMVPQSEAEEFRKRAKEQVELNKQKREGNEVIDAKDLEGFVEDSLSAKELKRRELQQKYADKHSSVKGPVVFNDASESILQNALGKYGHNVGLQGYGDIHSEEVELKRLKQQKELGDKIAKENKDVIDRTVPYMSNLAMGNFSAVDNFREPEKTRTQMLKESLSKPLSGAEGVIKEAWGGAMNRIFADRKGRTLGFAEAGASSFKKLANGALNVADMLGGPLMIALSGFELIISYISGLYEEYCNEVKEAKQAVSEAYSERREAENEFIRIYKEQNPDEEDKNAAENYMLEQYGAMYDSLQKNENNFSKWIEMTSQKTDVPKQYEMDEEADDGSMKEVEEEEKSDEEALREAINENSAALYKATAELQLANDKLVSKMMDNTWGTDSQSSQNSDFLGKMKETWGGFFDAPQAVEQGFLKTASQKDENYPGYTELAGLMLEDFKDVNGDLNRGLRTIYGSNGGDLLSTMSPQAKSAANSMALFAKSLPREKNARLQSSMMNDKKTWQKLAKEMAKYEKKTGKHAMTQETTNKRMENLIKKLQIDTHLNRAQVIAAAQLQQLQDMYEVAEQTFVPLMADQAATAAQLYDTTAGNVAPSTGEAAGGAISTAANAAQIAAYLSVMAQSAAIEASWTQDLMSGDTTANTKEEYIKEAVGTKIGFLDMNKPLSGAIASATGADNEGNYWIGGDKEKQKKIAHALEYQGDRLRNPEWTDQQVSDYSKRIDDLIDKGVSFSDAMELARKNYSSAVAPLVESAYLSSGVGENDDSGSGSGGGDGGGGGGDSGDKDNTGTKKERVDLVLCNKKEIPKLNVNLFKKPPSFTILNKNFKLRDLKINTEDKPKAIMSSIKNAFIDVQKRSDPKIIQDEEAEYDPVAATDGNATPSGSAKTKTDSKTSSN